MSDDLTTTEVPGLAVALKRAGIEVEVDLLRLNGQTLHARVILPDEVSALVLKTLAWRRRAAAKDAVDIWRTLEIALAAGLEANDFAESWSEGEGILMREFSAVDVPAMRAIAQSRGLSQPAAQQLHTRIKAMIERLAR